MADCVSRYPVARLRGAAFRSRAGVLLLTLTLTGELSAQTGAPPSNNLAAADNSIKGLTEVTNELIGTVADFHKRLDQAVARRDRGYRMADGRRIPGADADLASGQADLIQATLRKFVAFRMLAARGDSYQPAAAADMDRIQELIAESRKRVEASSAVLRRLLVVSINQINRADDAQVKVRHERLLKARADAQETARSAFLALPIDLPETSEPEDSPQKAWDLQVAGLPASPKQAGPMPVSLPKRSEKFAPLRIERRRRFTLIREPSLRMALTDSGIDDEKGRHLFYQEEWVQRGKTVVWMRWRVGVESATGQHVLIKRYQPLEFTGALDRYYESGFHSLWSLEPDTNLAEPSREQMQTAVAAVERSREAIQTSVQRYREAVHQDLLEDDRMLEAANEVPLDGGLSMRVREYLFGIRAHLAGVRTITPLESNIRKAIEQAAASVETLAPLAAWANRADEAYSPKLPAAEWQRLLDQCDREIDSERSAEAEAEAALPPDPSKSGEKFPALEKNLVVRMRGLPSGGAAGAEAGAHYLQEVWRRESAMPGSSEVRRTVTLMVIDPRTGAQTRAASRTRYYPIDPGGLLEEVFEEYAGQELIIGGASYGAR